MLTFVYLEKNKILFCSFCRIESGGDNLNIKERAYNLKKEIPAVYLALKDKETPLVAKMMAVVTVGYALSPIDIIPDFIPVLGYLDDVILLPALIIMTIKLIPTSVWGKCLKEAEDIWKDGKPKKWYCAIPIVIIWVFVVWTVIKARF